MVSQPNTKSDILDQAVQTALDTDAPQGMLDRIEDLIIRDIGARMAWRVFGADLRQDIREFVG